MCERARITIYQAFKNINRPPEIKPVLIAVSAFALKFTKDFRSDPGLASVLINSHFVEEATADAVKGISGSIKLRSFDEKTFNEALAARIMDHVLFFAEGKVSKSDVLRLAEKIKVDGQRTLAQWMHAWSRRDDIAFVEIGKEEERARDEGAPDLIAAPDVEKEIEAQSAALGITQRTDPNLCG